MLGNFSCFCCRLLTFFKINFFQKFFQEHCQSVKQFGPRSGPTFWWPWSWSKLFAKFISRRYNERVKYRNTAKTMVSIHAATAINNMLFQVALLMLTLCMLGNIACFFLPSFFFFFFFKINSFKKFFEKCNQYQTVLDPDQTWHFIGSWSGAKLFEKILSRQQKLSL